MVKNTKKTSKSAAITSSLLLIFILLVINFISSNFYHRFDLTAEKRFSLSEDSKKLLKSLDDVVYVKCYLAGDLKPEFRKFRASIEDMLSEMKQYAGSNLEFEFIDPYENEDQQITKDLMSQLVRQGLSPTDVQIQKEDGLERITLFPGVIMSYGSSKALGINLLNGTNAGYSPQLIINSSTEALEYEFANGIKNLTNTIKTSIAIVDNGGLPQKKEFEDIFYSLKQFYDVDYYDLGKIEEVPSSIKVLIIAKPTEPFSDWKKFKLDNYIMKGGRVLWCIDQLGAEMDSMNKDGFFLANTWSRDMEGSNLNIDDLLFKYGVRVNTDLIQDNECSSIPVVIGMYGNRPNQQLFRWPYYPIVIQKSNHPIVKNVDPIQFRYVSSIDTIQSSKVKKTILLESSRFSRKLNSPVRVNLSLVRNPVKKESMDKPFNAVAVLLEGEFESNYGNKIFNEFAQKALDSLGMKMYEKAIKPGKMIVVSDGDVILNHVSKNGDKTLPLGKDRFNGQNYGNRAFILNAIDYLADETGLSSVRGKEINLRLLNTEKVKKEKVFWQIFNLGFPLLILLIAGWIFNMVRKKRYATTK